MARNPVEGGRNAQLGERRPDSNLASSLNLPIAAERRCFASQRTTPRVTWATVIEALPRTIRHARFELRRLTEARGRGEPLVGDFDRMTLQPDLGTELAATAATERAAACQLMLGGFELPLGGVARLREGAPLLLEEPYVQLLIGA